MRNDGAIDRKCIGLASKYVRFTGNNVEMRSRDGYSTYSARHITVQSETSRAVDAVATAAAALDGLLPDSLIRLGDCNWDMRGTVRVAKSNFR